MSIDNEKWYQGGDNENGHGILTAERDGNYVCLIPDADDEGQKARAALIEKAPALARAVLEWWDKHRHACTGDGDEEFNLYDETPEFVKIAHAALGRKGPV